MLRKCICEETYEEALKIIRSQKSEKEDKSTTFSS